MTGSCSVLQVSETWPFSKEFPDYKKMLLMWTTRTSQPCYKTMENRQGLALREAETSQEQLKPHNVTSVVIVAAEYPDASTIWGMIGECKVEIMPDTGLSVSLIKKSMAAPSSNKHKISPSGLQLMSASGDNSPILGCTYMTLPLCIGEVQATHPLVVVKSLITLLISDLGSKGME